MKINIPVLTIIFQMVSIIMVYTNKKSAIIFALLAISSSILEQNKN